MKSTAFMAIAAAALAPLCLADPPQATAKIAEFAASSRGGKADYQEVSHGRKLDIDTLALPGKVTVVDFSSDYCAPCEQVAMFLIRSSKSFPGRYAIRRVDINRPGFVGIDWQSPVARQFDLKGIPFLVIYDKGVKVAEGDAARKWIVDDVDRTSEKANAAAEK
jgi:thiol-disulfide isomerase/thioredoxin